MPSPGLPGQTELTTAAAEVARAVGARLVVLFGSVARGESRADSDIDLAVLPDGALDLVDVTTRFIRLLRTQQVDLTDLRRADALLLALVARDGVPLFECEPGTFARFQSLAIRRFADTRKFRLAAAAGA